MFTRLLMLFIVVPVVEIYILVKAGQHIGAMNTIALVILTGIAGASLAKSQGAQIIYNIRAALNRGEVPGREMLQGAMVLSGGIMLLTPGFLTDLFGLSLLLPLSRKFFTGIVLNYFKKKFRDGQWHYYSQPGHGDSPDAGDVIFEPPKIDKK
jgi:UPF0716 protein FxsA